MLKHTDLTVSRFCMGGCPMGGYDWGDTNEEDFIRAINEALELGVNFFDTADTYGLGQSERTLAKGLGSNRQKVVIQTKFGVRAERGKPTVIDNSPTYLREALEQSLQRLHTDYIDIYVIHYWDQVTPPEEIINELERQRQAGKIRYFGLSNARFDTLKLCQPYRDKFATSQHEFSLCSRQWEAEIRQTEETMQTTTMTWGSLAQGMLSGKYNESSTFAENDRRRRPIYTNFHGDKLKHNMRIVHNLHEVAERNGKSCSATAIRFIMDMFPESVPIVGIKDAAQVRDNLQAQDWHLTLEEQSSLNRISHDNDGNSLKGKPWQKEF